MNQNSYMKTKKALAGLFGLFGSFAAFLDGFFPAAALLLLSLLTNQGTQKICKTLAFETKRAKLQEILDLNVIVKTNNRTHRFENDKNTTKTNLLSVFLVSALALPPFIAIFCTRTTKNC